LGEVRRAIAEPVVADLPRALAGGDAEAALVPEPAAEDGGAAEDAGGEPDPLQHVAARRPLEHRSRRRHRGAFGGRLVGGAVGHQILLARGSTSRQLRGPPGESGYDSTGAPTLTPGRNPGNNAGLDGYPPREPHFVGAARVGGRALRDPAGR